jgi:hypothetical protein
MPTYISILFLQIIYYIAKEESKTKYGFSKTPFYLKNLKWFLKNLYGFLHFGPLIYNFV